MGGAWSVVFKEDKMKNNKKFCIASIVLFFAVLIRVLCSERFFDEISFLKKGSETSLRNLKNGSFCDYDENGNLLVENTEGKVIFYDYDEENSLKFVHIIDIENGKQECIDYSKKSEKK